jgi:hypothetical protein
MTPKRRNRLAWILGGLAVVAGLLLLLPRHADAPEAEVAYLADGRKLIFQGATFGKEHTNQLSRTRSRLLDLLGKLPGSLLVHRKLLPNLNAHTFSRDHRITLSEPKLVLWFITPPGPQAYPTPPLREPPRFATPPRAPRSGQPSHPLLLRWKTLAPDGTSHGGTCFNGVPTSAYDDLHPICIDSYPRRLSEFTVQLFQPCPPDTNGVDAVWIGDFRVQNPHPSQEPVWTAEPLPARRESGGVICVLDRFQHPPLTPDAAGAETPGTQGTPGNTTGTPPEISHFAVHVNAGGLNRGVWKGLVFPIRDDHQRAEASLTIQDQNPTKGTWGLRLFALSDPTGNLSYPCSVAWKTLESGMQRLTFSTLPLWSDDPAWKIRLQLTRSGIPPAHRILVLKGLPFPRNDGTNNAVLQTNALGFDLIIRSLGPGMPGLTPNPSLNLQHPSFLLEFSRPDDDPGNKLGPMLQLLEVLDDTGRSMPSTELAPDEQIDVRHWRLSFHAREFHAREYRAGTTPTTIQSVDVTLGFPEERTFEFLVPSTSPGPAVSSGNVGDASGGPSPGRTN